MARPFLFFREYGFTIIFIVVFFLAFIWMGTKRTLKSTSNNVEDWLPPNAQETIDYKWFQKNFPMESFMVISWESCKVAQKEGDPNDEAMIEAFAQKLVPSQTIDNLGTWFSPQEIIAELDISELNTASEQEAMDPETQALVDQEKNIAFLNNIAEKVKEPETEAGEQKQYFRTVLTYPRLKKLLAEASNGKLSEEEIQYRLSGTLIGKDGASTAIMAYLKEQPKGKEADRVIEIVRQAGRELGLEPPLKSDNRTWYQKAAGNFTDMIREIVYGRQTDMSGLIIGGTPVDNAAISGEAERTLFRLAGFCALIGLTIAFLCFRSIRLTMFVFWTAILAAGIALAVVSLTGQHSDAIMLSMPALIYVLAMSGAIHLINYYHDAIRDRGLAGAPEHALRLGWFPCMIANLTTAFGLISLYTSYLPPIKKFGLYSAIGVMATLLLIFLYLPALLYFYPSRKYAAHYGGKGIAAEEHDSMILKVWRFIGGKIIKHHNLIAVGCCVLMIFFAFGLRQIKPEVKMMKFYSPDAPIIKNYTWLEKHLGPLVPMEVVIRFDNSTCPLTTVQRLRVVDYIAEVLRHDTVEEIGGVISGATMIPIDSSPEAFGSISNLRYATETAHNAVLDEYRPLLKDFVTMELPEGSTLDKLGLSESEIALLKANHIEDIAALCHIPPNEAFHGLSADDLEPYRKLALGWQSKHGHDLWRISARVWALQKADIDYSHLIGKVKDATEKFLQSDVLKEIADPLQDSINKEKFADMKIEGVDAVYTGMVPLVYQTQHLLIGGLINSLILAFVSIATVFCLILKSPIGGLMAMIPNVFPVIIVFGFMGWRGTLVDVGTMMTASVALGVAVDNTMHYLTWFNKGIKNGLMPKQAALDAYERCATAMTQTTLIGGLGLSAFMFSTFTPTQMFGIMMLAILCVSLIGDLIFLPAILTGPFGRFFIKKLKINPDAENHEADPSSGKFEKTDVTHTSVTNPEKELHDQGSSSQIPRPAIFAEREKNVSSHHDIS